MQISNNTVVSLSERRKHRRVSDAVALRLNLEGHPPSASLDPTPTHVVKMSCGGLRFSHSVSLDPGSALPLSMHIPSADKTVHIDSRVISSGEEKGTNRKDYFIQVEFQHINDEVKVLLKDHIDYVLEKTNTGASQTLFG